ncbi:MAG: MmcB family DNA repair protein [Pseudomonadota bacterium]
MHIYRRDLGPPLSGDSAVTADVARVVCRHFMHSGMAPLREFTLGNGRRADVAAIGEKGDIIIAEIKVSVGDFRGDTKWTSYLDYCDQFYFAVPQGFPAQLLCDDAARPERTGVIIADRFSAAVERQAAVQRLPAARRKAESLRFARKAAQRLHTELDPASTF